MNGLCHDGTSYIRTTSGKCLNRTVMLGTIEAWDNGSLHMLQSLSQFLVGSLWLKYAMLIKEDHFSRIDELIT